MVGEHSQYPGKCKKAFNDKEMRSSNVTTYTIMNDTLESVLQLLFESVRLENIDNTDEEEQPLTFIVSCWNATGTVWKKVIND